MSLKNIISKQLTSTENMNVTCRCLTTPHFCVQWVNVDIGEIVDNHCAFIIFLRFQCSDAMLCLKISKNSNNDALYTHNLFLWHVIVDMKEGNEIRLPDKGQIRR